MRIGGGRCRVSRLAFAGSALSAAAAHEAEQRRPVTQLTTAKPLPDATHTGPIARVAMLLPCKHIIRTEHNRGHECDTHPSRSSSRRLARALSARHRESYTTSALTALQSCALSTVAEGIQASSERLNYLLQSTLHSSGGLLRLLEKLRAEQHVQHAQQLNRAWT